MSSASALIQLLRLNTRQQIDGEDGGEGTLAKPNTHLLMFLAQHQQYRGCYYFTASKSQFGTFSRIGNIRRCFQNLFSGSEMSPRDGLFGFQVGECFGIRAPLSSVKCSSLTLDQKSPLTHQKHQKKPPPPRFVPPDVETLAGGAGWRLDSVPAAADGGRSSLAPSLHPPDLWAPSLSLHQLLPHYRSKAWISVHALPRRLAGPLSS